MRSRWMLIAVACAACDKGSPTSTGREGAFTDLGTSSETAIRIRGVAPGYWRNVAGAEVWVFEIVSGRDAKVQLQFLAPNQKVLHDQLGKHTVGTSTDELTSLEYEIKRGVPFVAYARLGHVSNLEHCFSSEPRVAGDPTQSFSCTEVEVGLVSRDGAMTTASRTIYRANSSSQRGRSWEATPSTG